MRAHALLSAALIVLLPSVGHAQPSSVAPEGLGAPTPSTFARVGSSGPRRAGSHFVALGASYGRSEAMLGRGDAHQRAGGALLLELAPLSFASVGLRLDGRYDTHTFAGGSHDDGWVGEPRLHVQLDRALTPAVAAGLRAVAWLPGAKAPSVVFDAATFDVTGLLSLMPSPHLRMTATGGYRIDRSARSVDDAGALSAGDRAALMVSAFDAALVGIGASYGTGALALYAEATGDLLVGAGAPSASRSPLRVGAGVTRALSETWAVELGGEWLASRRPLMPGAGPLVPLPPRYAVFFGVVAAFGTHPPRAQVAAPVAAESVVPEPPAPVVRPAAIRGKITGRVPRGLTVALSRPGGEELRADVGEDGAFAFDGLPPGRVTILAEAPGWASSRTETDLAPGVTVPLSLKLARTAPSGQIRGVVRSFAGKPVVATVSITAKRPGERAGGAGSLRSEKGAFSALVEPGPYEVVVEAPGFEPQARSVQVEEDGVTVLNVDLRKARR